MKIQQKNKIGKLWTQVTADERTISLAEIRNDRFAIGTSLEKVIKTSIVHEPVLYDLYKFLGVTYTNIETGAVPAELYQSNPTMTAWTFLLPVFGYKVPHGEDPEALLGTGEGSWEFQTTIAIVKTRIHLPGIPEYLINKARVFSFFG